MRYLCALALACVALAQTVIIDGSAGQGGTAVITASPAAGTGTVGRPPWGGNFTYYVDSATGSDSNPGTLALPFQTVSKVNGLTLTAGQSVGFKRGGMWRETLTPGQSGSSGRPITFGAYGSGAKPILNGSDVIAGPWTQPTSTLFSDTFANGTNWTKQGTAAWVTFAGGVASIAVPNATGTGRAAHAITAQSEAYLKFDITLAAGGTYVDNRTYMIQGLFNSAGDSNVGSVAFHKVAGHIYWSGIYADNASANNQIDSTTEITTGVAHTVEIYFKAAAGGAGIYRYWVDGVMIYENTGLTSDTRSATQLRIGENFAGTAYTATETVDNLSVFLGADSPNIWQATVNTQPNIVVYDGASAPGLGHIPGAYDSDKQWFWSGNVLSVYSATSPGSRFAAVESGSRVSCINTASRNFLVFDSLSLTKSNGIIQGGLTIGGSNHITLSNSQTSYNANAGVYIVSTAGGSLLITSNELDHNAFGVLSFQYAGGGAGTEAVISRNNIHDNNYVSAGSTWFFPEAIQMYGNYMVAEYNTVSNNGSMGGDSIGIHIYTGDGDTTYGQHNTIRYNVISGQISNGLDGSAIEFDHTTQNNLVSFNIAYGNHGPCIDVFGAPSNAVYNNTCYNNFQNPTFPIGKGEILISSTGSSTASSSNLIKNNLVYATQNGTYGIYAADAASLSNTIANNLLYDSGQANWYFWYPTAGATLATFNALSGVTANLNAAPLFTNAATGDFSIPSNSPAYQAGVFINGVTTATPNIGAK